MQDYYPPVAFNFSLSIAGESSLDASFHEVSGLDAERNVTEITEGGENRFVHRLPGTRKPTNLVLKRGIMLPSSALFEWCRKTLEADLSQRVEPKDVLVSLLDQKQQPMISWSLTRAWPVKWQVGGFDATEAIPIETLEFAYTDLTRKVVTRP